MKKILFLFFVCILNIQIKAMHFTQEFVNALNNNDFKKIQKHKSNVGESTIKNMVTRFTTGLHAKKQKLYVLENKKQLTADEIKEITKLKNNIALTQELIATLIENIETDIDTIEEE